MRAQDVAPATALLETATGALAAIENAGVRCGRDGLVTQLTRITVHIPKTAARDAARRIARMLAAARKRQILQRTDFNEDDVRDEAWATSWKQHYRPIHIAAGLYIAPSWERRFKPPRGSNAIWLDPGMAFGTGQHASTQLALNLMLPYVIPRSVVLDVGCGSGILGLAAARVGARVYASDLDSIAVQTTRANFAANKLRAAAIVRACDVPSSFPNGDLIVANLTAQILTRLAPTLARKLSPGGVLITSGFVKSAATRVARELERQGLELLETGGRAQIAADGRKAVITGLWRAYVHKKQCSGRISFDRLDRAEA